MMNNKFGSELDLTKAFKALRNADHVKGFIFNQIFIFS